MDTGILILLLAEMDLSPAPPIANSVVGLLILTIVPVLGTVTIKWMELHYGSKRKEERKRERD